MEVHQHQIQFLEDAKPGEAARFVFVIDRGFNESSDPRVVLLGFSTAGEEVCRWASGDILRRMGEATPSLPAPVELPKPAVTPKRTQDGKGDEAAASAGP